MLGRKLNLQQLGITARSLLPPILFLDRPPFSGHILLISMVEQIFQLLIIPGEVGIRFIKHCVPIFGDRKHNLSPSNLNQVDQKDSYRRKIYLGGTTKDDLLRSSSESLSWGESSARASSSSLSLNSSFSALISMESNATKLFFPCTYKNNQTRTCKSLKRSHSAIFGEYGVNRRERRSHPRR